MHSGSLERERGREREREKKKKKKTVPVLWNVCAVVVGSKDQLLNVSVLVL